MGLDKTKITEAQQIASKYSHDTNGLMQAIKEYGGLNMLKKALKVANNPLVKSGLGKLGVTDEMLKGLNGITSLNVNEGAIPPAPQNTTSTSSSLMERLKKLK